jgi:hypothetical protein
MSALPQPSPASPKGPRKPVSIRDKWRAKTNYNKKRFSGYAPISFAMVAEIGRLTAGKATQLLYVILTASLGTIVKETEEFNERACDLKTSDLADLCGCDDRTIQRELGDLSRRNVIAWDQSKKGVNNVTPLFRSWFSLPDYKPAPMLEPEPEAEDESPEDDAAANPKVITHLTKSPVYVKAGKKSKRIPIECGVAAIEWQVKGKVDAECSAVVQDGVLRVILEGKWDRESFKNETLEQKGIDSKMRQGCRISPNSTESKRTKGERGTKGEQVRVSHPRAEELSSLFDPLLLKSCGKSLSGDPSMLLAACEAIGQADHDYLVKCVIDRAERELKLVHVKAVCREIAHNWEKSKGMPAPAKELTREEMDAMVAADRAKRLAKRRAS